LITDKNGKINKIILKNMKKILPLGFHAINLTLIIFYLYPGSLLGLLFYNDSSIQPQITKDFLISSNHFYAFIILSIVGVTAYNKSNKINILIKYLFLLSILLEFFHFIIPNRSFELPDLFGNFSGIILVITFYKIKNKYA
jgi:glycopeptide antibiotics resistance protein